MGNWHKVNHILCLALILCANPLFAKEKEEPPMEQEPMKVATTNEKTGKITHSEVNIAPPKINNLACPEISGISPYLSLSAKSKVDEEYQTIKLGCIDLSDSEELLSDAHLTGIAAASDYLLDSKHFIRVYIDLEDAEVKDPALLKRFRTKAFALRNILTQKGIYDHLKANREGVFPPRFVKEEPKKVQKIVKVEKKQPKKVKAEPPPPKMDYTFTIDRSQQDITHDNLGIYGNHKGSSGFQFIPMQSIYFPHDGYKLSERAETTLLAMVDYILNHPETDKIIIQSHTDASGTKEYNFGLADRRALIARDFIIDNGVPEELIEVISRGEHEPVDENWTRQGQARNRRVEFYLLQRNALFSPTTMVQ